MFVGIKNKKVQDKKYNLNIFFKCQRLVKKLLERRKVSAEYRLNRKNLKLCVANTSRFVINWLLKNLTEGS